MKRAAMYWVPQKKDMIAVLKSLRKLATLSLSYNSHWLLFCWLDSG